MGEAPSTNAEMAKDLDRNPEWFAWQVFSAALSGVSARSDVQVQGPADAVHYALEATRAFLNIAKDQSHG